MSSFARRIGGAALLKKSIYEGIEHDPHATGQAVAIVVLASVAGGIGLIGLASPTPRVLVSGILGALLGWMAWATLTYLIGTNFLPASQTRANVGELLRTTAFATSPGLLRAFGLIPVVGRPLYALASVWMLVAMIVAVRQALDYKETAPAVVVCLVGWALSFAIAALIGLLFGPTAS
jgi:hypothetical protein